MLIGVAMASGASATSASRIDPGGHPAFGTRSPSYSPTASANPSLIDTSGSAPDAIFGEGRYRKVESEPSHPGKYRDAVGQWYELVGRFVLPDQFARTGDVDDAAAFRRAADYLAATGVTTLCLAPRLYDTSSAAIAFDSPVQMIGSGYGERGPQGAGTWIRCGRTDDRAFKFSDQNVRGARIDRIGFHQDHPAPSPNWRPIPYDYIIENVNAYGGIELGDVFFHGVNKGLLCDNSGRLFVQRLRGQIFTEGLFIDQCLDVPTIANMHLWPFATGAAPVITYQQANLTSIRVGRCDGFMGGKLFTIAGNRAIWLQQGTGKVPGVCTDYMIDSLYADQHRTGIYCDAGGSFGHVVNLTVQGENAAAGDGSALPGSAAVEFTAKAGGGYHSVTRLRAERYALGAVINPSSSTFETVVPPFLRYSSAAKQFVATGGVPVTLQRPPISDASASNLGTLGNDFTIVDGDEIIYTYYSTTNAAGRVAIAHKLGADGVHALAGAFGEVKGNSCESMPLTFAGMDGNAASFTSSPALAGRPVRITLRMRRFTTPW